MIQFRLRGMIATAKREARMIKADKNILLIIILAPLFYAFFYTAIYYHKVELKPAVILVDEDHSGLSRQLLRAYETSQYLDVYVYPDAGSAQKAMEDLDGMAIIRIPAGFQSDRQSGKRVTVSLYLNNAYFLVSNDINKAVNEVTATFGGGIKLKILESKGENREQALAHIDPISVRSHALSNPSESYGNFMIPALFILVLHQTLLIGLSESMADERATRSLGELYRTAEGSTWALVMGKGSFYLVLYCAYAVFFLTIGLTFFNLQVAGSYLALAVLTVLMILSVIYAGIFLASFFTRKIVALQILAFTTYPIFLASGYSWPEGSMPVWLQWLANLFPGTPYFQGFSRIVFLGADLEHVLPELLHLLLILALGITATRLRLPKIAKWQAEHY